MRFISYVFILSFILCSSCFRKQCREILPEHKVIKKFSEKAKENKNLVLYSYGVNNYLPNSYAVKNGVAEFSLSYYLTKKRTDSISLQEARAILVSIAESFLTEVNSDTEIRSLLDIYPFNSTGLDICIRFSDENRIDLGQGIATVCFFKNKIKYESYRIDEYRNQYPSIGEHYIVHEENYSDALEIVKTEGSMINLMYTARD